MTVQNIQRLRYAAAGTTQADTGFNMGFYFITEADPNWTQAKSQHQSMGVSSNGEFVTLTYDMSQNSAWNGTLKQLRFDPFDAPGTVEIDYIRFID